jgi:formate hydrogenlyase subunit 6/NADH:ubiquinone oxidoreductase subunit I
MQGQLEIPASALAAIIDRLRDRGYHVIAPVVRDQAIHYREISTMDELPRGIHDTQGPGTYALEATDSPKYFGFNLGPDSWRAHLLPKKTQVFSGSRRGDTYEIESHQEPAMKKAFFGIRACELQAIAIQDRIYIGDQFQQPVYQRHREDIALIAVNCTTAAETCFCPSFGINAEAKAGFDLVLTEIVDQERHYFVAEAATELGRELILGLGEPLTALGLHGKTVAIAGALGKIHRQIDEKKAARDLRENKKHRNWDAVAERCLGCANCTLVCPTCFCTTVSDVTDLQGDHTERWLQWDSCFNNDHSYIHDNRVHGSIKSRYRQWLTHKISSWYEQFGTSGCVGCGRCIAWCPAGIDLTDEVRRFGSEG